MENEATNYSDTELITRTLDADIAAFGVLVKRYEVRALHTAYSVLFNWEDAKDAAQEAFIKTHENLAKFKGGSLFFTWFYRILVNICKDFLRKKSKQSFLSLNYSENQEDSAVKEWQIPDSQAAPLEMISRRELEKNIQQAALKLPERQRVVFGLRFYDGLDLQTIAEVTELSLGAVKSHLWQALQKMRKNLKSLKEVYDEK